MPDIEVQSLASGSSGNAMLVRAGDQYLLIDAGFAGRTLAAMLHRRRVVPHSLAGILLTHEHDDHLRGAVGVCKRFHTPVIANRATLQAASDRAELLSTTELATNGEIG